MTAWLFGHKLRRQLGQVPHNLAMQNRPFLRRQKSLQQLQGMHLPAGLLQAALKGADELLPIRVIVEMGSHP